MRTITILILLIFIAAGCGGGTSTSGGNSNPNNGKTATPAGTGSKLGSSGGFVDVDGDGIADLVIGAPNAAISSNLGAAYVYKGNSSGGYSSNPAITLKGDDNFGYTFAKIDDDVFAVTAINGDGDDSSICGAVYIYKGGSNGPTLIRKLAGEWPLDKFGFSIASGDLNSDGYKDIIIGAPYHTNDPAVYKGGAVYIYFGPDFTNRIALYASSTNKGIGWQAATGDINNDGISDLLISVSGKVLGFYGVSAGALFAPNINSPDLTISSSASGFGKTIAVLGDLNGDGYGDIAIGAPNAVVTLGTVSNRDTGSLYIIKGGTGARTVNLNSSPAPADLIVRIDGADLFYRFGSSIATVDADGDNLTDIAVGAPTADTSLVMSGKVYLFKGKLIGPATTIANATIVFNGDAMHQGFGFLLAPASNAKLLIGAPWSNKYSGKYFIGDLVTGGTSGGGGGGGDDHQH
ncbi:MAG: FG-GAP-like repeat-containing protein [Nitrospirota bacterium]